MGCGRKFHKLCMEGWAGFQELRRGDVEALREANTFTTPTPVLKHRGRDHC